KRIKPVESCPNNKLQVLKHPTRQRNDVRKKFTPTLEKFITTLQKAPKSLPIYLKKQIYQYFLVPHFSYPLLFEPFPTKFASTIEKLLANYLTQCSSFSAKFLVHHQSLPPPAIKSLR